MYPELPCSEYGDWNCRHYVWSLQISGFRKSAAFKAADLLSEGLGRVANTVDASVCAWIEQRQAIRKSEDSARLTLNRR